ncbi:alpha/beta fold hydrolase [Nocardioides marmoriginsengisoli]|uniref:Alpha/beta fold hydrolase n=1 Tax=Nocardioides marmoriginsengisoli TaxID=661483 RepID=A0A3N0CJ80_9ACTN|nr:alpha/beta fold hydrolase [Nocardioides marmoriginsengisoli]RNL63321.1 alpha/beta fold hydrolase [Nocardioides marmoriginsengisoli]
MSTPFVKASSVQSADGTRLAVFESGNPEGPVLVAVHGYPDNHTVWDGIAAELGDRYRVIAYDVRGAGDSDKPAARSSYKIARLVEDFTAVIDAVSPDTPVHLLAHDWGSIQSWGPVTDPALAPRIASYTSISGPCLDYVGVWMRDRKHPGASLRQALKSWYIAAFQIPALPERIVSLGVVDRGIARTELKGHPAGALANPVQRSEADKVNGIKLYRANMPSTLARPRPVRTSVPVQVLAPVDDAFVSVRLATETPAPFVDDLTISEIAGSHWVVSESPERVAAYVDAFAVKNAPAAPAATRKRKARR